MWMKNMLKNIKIKNMLKIKEKIGKPTSIYRVAVRFMEGDADGWETEYVDVPETEIESEEFKNFIKIIQKMIKLDRKGRRGMDSCSELVQHYKQAGIKQKDLLKFFDIGWYNEDDEEEELDVIASKYQIEYPTESEGFYHSLHNLKMTYFDKNGDEFEVELQN